MARRDGLDDSAPVRRRRVVEELQFPPIFIFVIVAVVVFLIIRVLSGPRHPRGEMRVCRACGASHPGFAKFCRRCGRQL